MERFVTGGRGGPTVPNLLYLHHCRGNKVCRVLKLSNLHEPHHHRESKVCRGLSQEFGVVRLYRTFSSYIVIGETRSAGCLCNFIEPSHYTSIVPVCRVLSHHRTSIPAAVQEIQCVQGGCALVRSGSSTSNLIENLHEPHHNRDSNEVVRCA